MSKKKREKIYELFSNLGKDEIDNYVIPGITQILIAVTFALGFLLGRLS